MDMVDTETFKRTNSDKLSRVDNLYSYLHIDKTNAEIYRRSKENLEQLFNMYNRTNMVSFIGAGTSKPLGIPDWEPLMNDLCAKAEIKGFNGELPNAQKEWPQFAQDIYDYLKEHGYSDHYFKTILSNMILKITSTTATLENLVLALDVHLTTNFDKSIQAAYDHLNDLSDRSDSPSLKKSYKSYYLPDFDVPRMTDVSLIYYLHGSIDRGNYILTKTDYDTFYPSISGCKELANCQLENFLKDRYRYNSIIFLGFSFDDCYVREFFERVAKDIDREQKIATDFYSQSRKVYEKRSIKHFLVINAGVLADKLGIDIHDEFEAMNIYSIIYKDGQHIFLEKLFQNLDRRGKIDE